MFKEVSLVVLSNHGAALRDLDRFRQIFKNHKVIQTSKKNLILRFFFILTKFNFEKKIYIHIHSDLLGIIFKIFFRGAHYQVCHNTFSFNSRENIILDKLDKIIYFFNIYLARKKIFISKNIFSEFNYDGKLIDIHRGIKTIKKIKDFKKKKIFFFGRDLPYKNIQFIIDIAALLPDFKFEIHSDGIKKEKYKNLVENIFIFDSHLSEKEIDNLYFSNHTLILPYLSAPQSGPFYLAIENNLNIIASEIDFFKNEKSYYKNLFLINGFNAKNWANKIKDLFKQDLI